MFGALGRHGGGHHGGGGRHGGGGGGRHHGGGGHRPYFAGGGGGAYFAPPAVYGPWGYPTDVYLEPQTCDLVDNNGNCILLGGPRIVGRPRVLLSGMGAAAVVVPEVVDANAEPPLSPTETSRIWLATVLTLGVVAGSAYFRRSRR